MTFKRRIGTDVVIYTAHDEHGKPYSISLCHWCNKQIDWRKGDWYQDSLGRWEYCGHCYVHVSHPAGQSLAWWYADEISREFARS